MKTSIQRHQAEAVSLQRISKIDGTVIKANAIDEPLAEQPPRLVGADWNRGLLTLTLDRPVTPAWIDALNNLGGYSAVLGKSPSSFAFREKQATISAAEHEAQAVVDHFKNWLPAATLILKQRLEGEAVRREADQKEQLRR